MFNETRKYIFPTTACILSTHLEVVNGMEYYCFGEDVKGVFFVDHIEPVSHMYASVLNIYNQNHKTGFCQFLGKIMKYQNGKEIPHSRTVLMEGYFYSIYKETEANFYGYWETTSKGSQKFRVIDYKEEISSTDKTLYNYLYNVLKGNRIQKNNIKALINEFGTETLDIIKKYPARMESVIKKKKQRDKIHSTIVANTEKEEAYRYVTENNILSKVGLAFIDVHKSQSMSVLRDNPYELIEYGATLKEVDKLAKKQSKKYDNPKRIRVCIKLFLAYKMNKNGDVYITLDEFFSQEFDSFLTKFGAYENVLSYDKIEKEIQLLQSKELITIEKNKKNDSCVYLQRYHKMENYISNKLKILRQGVPNHFTSKEKIEKYIKQYIGADLEPTQKKAIFCALENKVSIITGGPGTGKTYITKIIVEIATAFNSDINIELCAPTGKASQRMSEVIGIPAKTIHRRLNYVPYEKAENMQMSTIESDLLIIDELSMVDIALFYYLLKNTSEKTSIILIGDYNQLPSIGPGLILRDLVDSGRIPCTKLNKIFRQKGESDIIRVSYNVLSGIYDKKKKKTKGNEFLFINATTEEKIRSTIKKTLKYPKFSLQKDLYKFQIMSPINNGPLGNLGINKELQDVFNPKTACKKEIWISPTKMLREQDKVIQTVNNYDTKVFNGTMGVIEKIDTKNNCLLINFDGETKTYTPEQAAEISLAYSISIHKSQGSEFDYVAIIIDKSHGFFLNRNLLYTAISRAKKAVIVIGFENTFENGVKNTSTISRRSNIKEKLENWCLVPLT